MSADVNGANRGTLLRREVRVARVLWGGSLRVAVGARCFTYRDRDRSRGEYERQRTRGQPSSHEPSIRRGDTPMR